MIVEKYQLNVSIPTKKKKTQKKNLPGLAQKAQRK
jgi:hypothetical protein